MTLALVDDDADVRKGLGRLVRSLGHDVRSFASAEEFERDTVVVDCAIVDVRLPGASGVELAGRLRRRRPPVPVVLITGDAEPVDPDALQASGAVLVTKPFDDVRLIAAMSEAIAAASSASRAYVL